MVDLLWRLLRAVLAWVRPRQDLVLAHADLLIGASTWRPCWHELSDI
jgi:hypothetical protein